MKKRHSVGLFWQDAPKAVQEKRSPPAPVWLAPDYLPKVRLDPLPLMSDGDLIGLSKDDVFILDVECYPNYCLIMLTSYKTGKALYEEIIDGQSQLNVQKLNWIFDNFQIVTFNGIGYDIPIVTLAMHGYPCGTLKQASNEIISDQLRPFNILKKYKVKKREFNHIDLIEVAPLKASLKLYGGRMHVTKLQDLPFHHASFLNPTQINIVRNYCFNDTSITAWLYSMLQEELNVRIALSKEYGIDLRSKSDAQIAETVISKEVAKINGDRIKAPEIPEGTVYKYKAPANIKFETHLMQQALAVIENENYVVNAKGRITLSPAVKALKLRIADGVYRMGIGGLHSSETKVVLKSTDTHMLIDRDVASYYPSIILNLALFPKHLGQAFMRVYRTIVQRRLKAKAEKRKTEAATLKIVINGSFGKLINKYSDLYAPFLGISVTIAGQLYLLMLIERMELAGIRVVSANTDGIVLYCERSRKDLVDAIVKQWELDTKFETEETLYSSIYIRDVNNYMAVKPSGEIKEKGAYANPWKDNSTLEMLKKNPTNTICIEAVQKFLLEAKDIERTIKDCCDVRKFITIRDVDGGAVKLPDSEYIGKVVRWYYAKDEVGEFVYARSGNKVPRSDGAKPIMDFDNFPKDIDYDWYVNEAKSILSDLGVA